VQGDAGRKLRAAIVEENALGVVEPHHADDVLHLEGMREARIAHVAPGRVVHLRLLQVELRRRKAVEIADMVVVQVGQDHVLHAVAVDADQLQRLDRIAQMRAPALRRDLRR
jgi:hypothetical protein